MRADNQIFRIGYRLLGLLAIVWLLSIQHTVAQSYVKLADASGLQTSMAELASLTQAADDLISILPDDIKDHFAVYDFGFYVHNEVFTDYGYPEVFEDVVAGLDMPYYLVFGKQSDASGIYTKIWVDLKLPDTGKFQCIDLISPGFRSSLTKKIEIVVMSTYSEYDNSPFTYATAERAGMDTLKNIISNIVNCCDPGFTSSDGCNTCLFTGEEIILYLNLNDYIKFPISIDPSNKLSDFDCSASSSALKEVEYTTYNRSVSSILNYVDYDISIDGVSTSLESLISSTMPSGVLGDFKIHIMDFDNIINSSFYEAENEVKEANGGLIYFVDNYSDDSYLYISPTAFDINLHVAERYIADVIQSDYNSNTCKDCPAWMLEIWNDDYNSNEGSILATYIVPAIPLSAVDGPILVADAIIAAAAAAAITYDVFKRVYITYIAVNPLLNQYYCGRASGFGTPEVVLYKRIIQHHVVTKGYIAGVDKHAQVAPYAYWATRGREQQNIDFYGGALLDPRRRLESTCVNKIRGVGVANPFGYLYHWSSNIAWGEKYEYTGLGSKDIEELWPKLKEIERVRRWLGI